MKSPRFVVYKTMCRAIGGQVREEWRWRLVAANGRIVATGEAHTRKADAERAARGVAETAAKAECPG